MNQQRAMRTARQLLGRKPRAHMLHIGKTGGTALKSALGPLRSAGRYEICLHEHDTTLRGVPDGEPLFFVLRDPVSRFVSAFNSRLREGRPRHLVRWNNAERLAFEEFGTADELACALSGADAATRSRAIAAMSSIMHVRDSYWDWLGDGETLHRRRDDVMLVLWMPDLAVGFERLAQLLELPGSPSLPTDEVASHRSPATMNTSMSEQGGANLRLWFTRDYACVEMCSGLDRFVGPAWTSAWPLPTLAARAQPPRGAQI